MGMWRMSGFQNIGCTEQKQSNDEKMTTVAKRKRLQNEMKEPVFAQIQKWTHYSLIFHVHEQLVMDNRYQHIARYVSSTHSYESANEYVQ